MIAHDLEVTLHLAFVEARKARHEDLTLEHLLYALLDNPPAADQSAVHRRAHGEASARSLGKRPRS